MNMIDVMRTLISKTIIDINDEMTLHNKGLMIKPTTGC
jgi:hypothetical protein